MFLVHLRVSDGSAFAVRCRELSRDALVPGNVLLIGVLDPVVTPGGPFAVHAWSVGAADVANYMQGEYQAAAPVPPEVDDCDERDDDLPLVGR